MISLTNYQFKQWRENKEEEIINIQSIQTIFVSISQSIVNRGVNKLGYSW
jgi:hypothetical protein